MISDKRDKIIEGSGEEPLQAAKIKLFKINEPIFLNGGTCFTTCDFYEDMTHTSERS